MNNLKSYTEYAVTNPTTDFVIGFDFNYGTDAVNITVDDVPATEAGYSVIYLNSTTVRLSPAVPTGVVRLQRETDIDVPDNQFTAGAKFIASNMDENFTQLRHAQQEVRDGFGKLSEDTYEIIDTLQVVGQAAQDAADAAEQAAELANDAAAQVSDKVSKSATLPTYLTVADGVDPVTGVANGAYFNARSLGDESYVDEYQNVGGSAVATGKSYPSSAAIATVRNNTAYFYPTVAQMMADANLVDGAIAATKGYHTIGDSGGTIYLISSTSTDYSIPLENGLHAVFRDTFDIRKFGVVSNPTLDQTENLLRMRNYADTRVHEIDFLNFEIMSPKCVNFTSFRGTIYKGLYFHYVHKLKNAKFYHDKTEQLYQGATPLQFTPKADGAGLFELENIRFDLYVADYFLVSGEGDGRFHGFYVGWHSDFPMAWPSSMQFQTGYSLKFNGIYADTPAITSTMALNLWCTNIDFKDMFGEYWAYYTTHFAERVTAENCHFVFRDDLHTGSGRVLVTNGFQEEQEVGAPAFPYHQKIQRFKNSSCYKKTDGARHPLIKRQVMGAPTLDLMEVDNCIGTFVIAAGSDKAGIAKIKHLKVSNCYELGFDLDLDIDLISFYKSANPGFIRTESAFSTPKMEFDQHRFDFQIAYTGVTIDELVITDSEVSAVNTNGIVRSGLLIKKINVDGLTVKGGRIFECDFDTVVAKGITYTDTPINRGFVRTGSRTTTSRINIDGMVSNVTQTSTSTIIETTDTKPIVGIVTNSTFRDYPRFTVGTGGSLIYANSYPHNQVSVAYDPPALTSAGTAGDTATTTVTLAGTVAGDFVQAAFSQYNAGIELSAVVSAANTVTVKFKNTTATAVDLPRGTLKVRLI